MIVIYYIVIISSQRYREKYYNLESLQGTLFMNKYILYITRHLLIFSKVVIFSFLVSRKKTACLNSYYIYY